ncbi:MFS transporter [Shimazuella kribbensis]|uniref:MFS transporter n=1 Tax=Shimazuella kribbensis TaxID=139808 RepID=UPI00042833C4|nr:MFS transporter [Shimazuella kribbensis]
MALLLPHIDFKKPFQWANPSTWKTNILGSFVAFWVTFTILGANLLVAEKVGKEVVPGILLFFYLFGTLFAGVSGLLGRTMSRKAVLLIGLALMMMGTIALNFVNSFGLFTLVYILMAIGYFPVISITASLHMDFVPDDNKSRGRGRSCWGTLNNVASASAAIAILMVNHGWTTVWFAVSMSALVCAAFVVKDMKEEVAVKEQQFTEPLTDRLPFYQQLLTKDKSIHFSWKYVLVAAGSQAVRMWPVFFMEEWVAVAMIFCGELVNGLCGPLQVRLSQWLEKKDKATQQRISWEVSNGTLVAFAIALLFIWTGVAALCIIGAALIGVAVRVFTYLEITQSPQKGRGAYTYFFVRSISLSLGCVVAMVSMTMLGMMLPLMVFTLIGIVYYNKVRLRNLISSPTNWRKAKKTP